MPRIQVSDGQVPIVANARLLGRLGASLAQLAKKLFAAVVGETEISAKELLIEQRRAQEARKLLLLHRVTREGQNVTVSDKDGASQPAFAGAQKSQLTLDQRYAHGVAAEVEILDVIDLAGFDAQGDRKSTRLNSSHVRISYA